jgi:hypothetical protein
MITHRLLRSSAAFAGIFLLAMALLPIHSPAAQNLLAKKIKAVEIIGNDKTKEDLFRRELSPVIGRTFANGYLDLAYNRLDRLGIFSGIKVTPVEEADGVILRVEVKETLPILPVVSLSISDENGIQFGGGVKALNLKGEAITMSAKAMFGGATNLEFRLANPWITGDKFAYSLDFYYRERQNGVFDFAEKSFEAFTTFSRQRGYSVNYGGRFNLQLLKSDVPGKTLSSDNGDFVSTLAFFYIYDTRDAWSNPHTGWWNEVEILKSDFLTGQSDFWRVNFDLRRYQPLPAHVGPVLPAHLDDRDRRPGRRCLAAVQRWWFQQHSRLGTGGKSGKKPIPEHYRISLQRAGTPDFQNLRLLLLSGRPGGGIRRYRSCLERERRFPAGEFPRRDGGRAPADRAVCRTHPVRPGLGTAGHERKAVPGEL